MPPRGWRAIQFENLKTPALNHPLAQIQVEGLHLDLHRQLHLVGFTFGIEPTSATLGWAAKEPLLVIRSGQALPVSGLALHFSGVSRFEVAFESEPPGQLDYFEFLNDPEPLLRFFFEGGTVRIAGAVCRAELVTGNDDEEEAVSTSSSGLLQ
ncbi:MAG: hypothetical protein ACRD04_09960 [Terriglobales bacterium]